MEHNKKEKLAISFWIWALQDLPPGGCYHNFDQRMRELKERGFNCIGCESGAGLSFDLQGNPRGKIEVLEPFPGFSRKIRQQFAVGVSGCCDYRKRLLELFAAAKRHGIKIILTSFYYLHTYWYTAEKINDELFEIPDHDRFRRFAELLDRILVELEEHDLISQLAFAEVFNEADGLPFVGGYGNARNFAASERLRFRNDHEAALEFLQNRHPKCTFAYSTYTPFTDPDLMPRNAAVWNFHAYYMWPVYDLLERGWVSQSPGCGKPDGRFVNESVSLKAVRDTRNGVRPAAEDWYRRVWLYANLRPERLSELETLLTRELEKKETFYRERTVEALKKALQLRDQWLPKADLAMSEGATYCGAEAMNWEERSPAYWRIIYSAAEQFARAGITGFTPRSNSGSDEVGWNAVKQLRHANRIYLETCPEIKK